MELYILFSVIIGFFSILNREPKSLPIQELSPGTELCLYVQERVQCSMYKGSNFEQKASSFLFAFSYDVFFCPSVNVDCVVICKIVRTSCINLNSTSYMFVNRYVLVHFR